MIDELNRWQQVAHRGIRFRWFEIFRGLSGGWYIARLPVGYPYRIL